MNKKVFPLVLYTLCATLSVVAKEVLSFLPNIELVSFLFIIFALHFPIQGSIFIAIIFCFLQIMLYGIGVWTPIYFVVWSGLVIVVYCAKGILINEQRCAILSGVFGLSFGIFFSIPFFIISWQTGWISYLKGIPFDLIHMIGNYIIMLILYQKINAVVATLVKKYKI